MREIGLEGGIGLLPLLRKCLAFDTTNPLDRVYALRALAADVDLPRPDYTLTIEQLFSRLARSFIRRGRADILAHAGFVHHEDSMNVPFWFPTWERSSSYNADHLIAVYKVDGFQAAGLTIPEVRFVDTDEKLLKVYGAAIDTVESVTAGTMISYMSGHWSVHLQAVETLRASAPRQTMSRAESEWMLASLNQALDSDPPYGRFKISHCFAIESLLQVLTPIIPFST